MCAHVRRDTRPSEGAALGTTDGTGVCRLLQTSYHGSSRGELRAACLQDSKQGKDGWLSLGRGIVRVGHRHAWPGDRCKGRPGPAELELPAELALCLGRHGRSHHVGSEPSEKARCRVEATSRAIHSAISSIFPGYIAVRQRPDLSIRTSPNDDIDTWLRQINLAFQYVVTRSSDDDA